MHCLDYSPRFRELLGSIDKHPLSSISHAHRAYKGEKFLSAFDLK